VRKSSALRRLISSHIRNEDDDQIEQSIREVIQQGQYARGQITPYSKWFMAKNAGAGRCGLAQIQAARDVQGRDADVLSLSGEHYGSLI